MTLELRQQLKLAQKLVMTPQLRQAIRLLQLNRLELVDALQTEIEQNPALEEDLSPVEPTEHPQSLSSTTEGNQSDSTEPDFTERIATTENLGDINWNDYANNFDSNFSFARETPPADAPSQFDFISQKPGLIAHLQWQLAHADLDETEMDIALFILGNLNRYGFLEISLEEIMEQNSCDRDTAEYILEVIQDLDPPGIGARDINESLYLQLERLGQEHSLAAEIVKNHLPLLETRNYKALARATGQKKADIMAAVEFIIDNLTPYPGLPFAVEETNYVIPDVYVIKVDDDYIISLNDDDLPRLKLSSYYQDLLKNGSSISKESRSYVADKLKDAEWFIKSIHQRQRTIYKVMESLLRFQRDFFDYGPKFLKPLILRDVAEDIEMHESTISRVTSNKYAHTPQGIFELKYFFSTAIPRQGGEALASESIRTRIKKMIMEEDKSKPLSDHAISMKLAEGNIEIARRTVAKYREQLKILPVKYRRQKKL